VVKFAFTRRQHRRLLVRSRYQPSPTAADPVVATLVKDLDCDVFATREEATRKLQKQGAKAEHVLRRALASTASPEMKRRIEDILAAISPPPLRLPFRAAASDDITLCGFGTDPAAMCGRRGRTTCG
jgi:hypothetical protein